MFGDSVSALLALADDREQVRRIEQARSEQAVPVALRDTPGEWADETVEAVYAMGRERPKLAPLFGDGASHSVGLPAACSAGTAARRWVWLGRMFADGDHHDRALSAVEQGLSVVERDALTARLLGIRVEVLVQRRELDRAREAREMHASIGSTHWVARDQVVLGRVAVSEGDHDAARDHFEAALEIFEEVGAPHDALQTLEQLYDCSHGDDARRWRRRAEAVATDAPQATVEAYGEWVDTTPEVD